MVSNVVLKKEDALLIIDMQNDFIPRGSLEVKDGDKIIKPINKMSKMFHKKDLVVVYSKDWHPKGHGSFASSYEGKKPGDLYDAPGLGPLLWPNHCVQNTFGAEISSKMKVKNDALISLKGMTPNIDSYSALYDNDKKTSTGLTKKLKDRNIKRVFICGLALDYCCFNTAMDAKNDGFEVVFVEDLTKGVDIPEGNIAATLKKMKESGILITNAGNIKKK